LYAVSKQENLPLPELRGVQECLTPPISISKFCARDIEETIESTMIMMNFIFSPEEVDDKVYWIIFLLTLPVARCILAKELKSFLKNSCRSATYHF
jgi:hypothetical protein